MKFSNGQPMTSADVKFSIDQASAAAKGWGYINTAIKSVAAPSPQTVVVNLKYPWAPLLADLSLFSNAIVPANYGGQTETAVLPAPDRHRPVQVGLLAQGLARSSWSRNPYYWQQGKPYLNSVTWTDVPSDNTRELQLKGGQAQVDEFPAWSTVASLKTTPGVTMNLFNSTRTDYLAFNETRQAVPGRARAPGDLATRSTGPRWSRPCCSATASRPTRCSRRRCPTTSRPPRASSTT